MLLTLDNGNVLAGAACAGDGVSMTANEPAVIDAPKRLPKSNDRVEISAARHFAGVSDRGIHHDTNEDFLLLSTVEILVSPIEVPPVYIAVVCDGVSSSASGDSASAAASVAAVSTLNHHLTLNPDAPARAVLRDAVHRANEAVCSIACPPGGKSDPPATTIVAAIVQDGRATIAWIGDSRAYWVTETDCGLLTRDDSWVNAMIDAGRMTEEESKESPNLHALFRCLGREYPDDSGTAIDPSYASLCMAPGTRLILCSDGFWNYADTAQNVARLVRQTPVDDPLKTAKHLVNVAIAGGGHDNITVAVLSL